MTMNTLKTALEPLTAGPSSRTRSFLEIEPTGDPLQWTLVVAQNLCVGMPGSEFLFGGVGLGLAIAALEGSSARPVIWATSQYTAYARPGERLDLQVELANSGNSVTQARAVGRVDGREIFSVSSALGARPGPLSRQWLHAPDVPRPAALEPESHWRWADDDLHSRLDVRAAHGSRGFVSETGTPSEDARLILWARAKDGQPVDASLLAVLADLTPSAVGHAVGLHAGGNSLDNTLRINRLVDTEWVLVDIQIQAVEGGLVQGATRLFAEDGTLLATANQTMILRLHKPVSRTRRDASTAGEG